MQFVVAYLFVACWLYSGLDSPAGYRALTSKCADLVNSSEWVTAGTTQIAKLLAACLQASPARTWLLLSVATNKTNQVRSLSALVKSYPQLLS